mmetsp:Transcript_43768/g.108294  ORF Transcript_43768/g.108294 Transcript_43768/m.108294 type:complete len:81 (-) Transcript_43768:1828-2070(-)
MHRNPAHIIVQALASAAVLPSTSLLPTVPPALAASPTAVDSLKRVSTLGTRPSAPARSVDADADALIENDVSARWTSDAR